MCLYCVYIVWFITLLVLVLALALLILDFQAFKLGLWWSLVIWWSLSQTTQASSAAPTEGKPISLGLQLSMMLSYAVLHFAPAADFRQLCRCGLCRNCFVDTNSVRDWQVGKRKPAFYIILHRYAGVPMHEGYFLLANLINKSNYCRCRSSSFKLFFDQSTKPFASFGLRVPVISVARAMALTGVVKSFNPHKAARWCHSDPRWMPCECHVNAMWMPWMLDVDLHHLLLCSSRFFSFVMSKLGKLTS